VIGGWFCPVVNFWFPKQIVDDVIAASDPRTPPLFPDLRQIPPHDLVLAWWLIWVVTEVWGPGGTSDLAADVPDVSDQAVGASVSTLGVVLIAVCAVLAIRVVRLVNRLQMSRPWTPWWATYLSTAPQLWPAQHLQQIQGGSVTTPHDQGPQPPYRQPQQPYGQPGQPPAQYGQAPQSLPYGQPQQPNGQPPYGASQMGYPAAPGGVKPNNYLAWSIVSVILFWPLGIAAIINATKVDPAWQMGNAALAQEHSHKAKMFSIIATIIGAVWFVISLIIGWRLGSLAANIG
jgi:hypothetical protein